ncbi:hypothetical protein ACHAWX_001021 [Stephanocyclus meneghinianus]
MTWITKPIALLLLFIGKCNAFSFTTKNINGIVRSPNFIPFITKEKSDETTIATKDDRAESSSRRNAIFLFAASMLATDHHSSRACAAPTQQAGVSSFLGTYADPINHPGGKRTVRLLEDGRSSAGDYALAQVYGGGGVGEPEEYVLPAVILGDRAIIIDFGPKGGPRDFAGVLEKDGSIRFLRDGNRWPRVDG